MHLQHFFSAHLTCLPHRSLLLPEPILWLSRFPSSSSLIRVRFEINPAEWDPVSLGGLKLRCLKGNKIQNAKYQRKFKKLRFALQLGNVKNGTLVLYIKLTDCTKGWAGFCCLLVLVATWMITHEASYTKQLKMDCENAKLWYQYTCDTLRPKSSWFHDYWFWHLLDYSDT